MKIRFNGEQLDVSAGMTLQTLIKQQLGDQEAIMARSVVAVNQSLVPKQDISEYQLQDSDDVELLTAVVGG